MIIYMRPSRFLHIFFPDSPKKDCKEAGVYLVEWGLLIALTAISFLVFYYTDYSDTLDNSVMLAEAFLDGHLSDYYQYASRNAYPETVYTANYNIFLYGMFAIWNLPVILLHRLNGYLYMESVYALLWCKLLILTALVLTAVTIRKLVQLYISCKRSKVAIQILFLGCACTWIPTMVAVQYDILSLLAILLGIYFYIQKKDHWFYVFFAIAFPLKSFAIFVFIPLLLLKEKRILCLIPKFLSIFSIQLAVTLPFRGDPWYEMCLKMQSRDALNLLLTANVNVGAISVNLFVFGFVALCVFCYISKTSETTAPYLPIWCSFAAIAALLLFINFRSYWIILLIPFAMLTVFFNTKFQRTNMLLTTLGGFCGGIYILMNHWIYSTSQLVTKLGLKLVNFPFYSRGELKYRTIGGFFSYFDLNRYSTVMRTIFISSIIFLLILNFPYENAVKQWRSHKAKLEHWPIILQSLLSLSLVFLLLYANIATTKSAVYTTNGENNMLTENVMTGQIVEQYFLTPEANEPITITELSFSAKSSFTERQNRDVLHFSLIDTATNEIQFQKTFAAGMINNQGFTRITFEPAVLQPKHSYCLQIQGESIRHHTEVLLFKSNAENEDRCLTVNGITIPGELVFTLR